MTDKEWAAIFRLMQKAGALVNMSHEVYDAEIETVGRKRVTIRQTFDAGDDSVDHDTVYEYANLDTVTFWVAS